MGSFAKRWNTIAAVVVVACLAGVLTLTALDTSGYRAAKVELNDASVWVTGSSIPKGDDTVPQVGRINTETPEIEAAISPNATSEVFQDGNDVLIRTGTRLVRVEPGTDDRSGGSRGIAADTRVALGGGTAAIVQRSNGAMWLDAPAELVRQEKDAQAQATVDKESLLVVSLGGTAYAYAPGAATIKEVPRGGLVKDVPLAEPLGADVEPRDGPSAIAEDALQLTTVGEQPVLLHVPTRTLVIGGRSVELPDEIDVPALQQPGPTSNQVIVSSNTGLWSVPLNGGAPSRVVPKRSGVDNAPAGARMAVRPALSSGCLFGAWKVQSGSYTLRVCPQNPAADAGDTINVPALLANDQQPVFRTNNTRTVLNNPVTGASWYHDDQNVLRTINNWSDLQKDDQQDESDKTEIRDPKPKVDCDTDADVPLKIDTLEFGARAGVPTLLPVFADKDKIKSASCTVLSIDSASTSDGTVDIASAGGTLQFTPKDGVTAATISYRASDGRHPEPFEGQIQVSVFDNAAEPNVKPDSRSSGRATTVVAGQRVAYNVMPGTIDPEGDALALIDACVSTGGNECLNLPSADRSTADGTIQHQSDGWIRYLAPAGITGNRTIAFVIQDQWGAREVGTVVVRVKAPNDKTAIPVPQDDQIRLVKGTGQRFDPTANDVSPTGRSLTLNLVEPVQVPDAGSEQAASVALVDGSNDVEIPKDLPVGSYLFRYTVSDGTTPVPGFVRIDVVDPKSSDPVAVRDEAVLHGKQPLQLDLVANDFDPAGGMLVVTFVTPPRSAEDPMVQLLNDRKTVRITAPADFAVGKPPVQVNYTVSNGTKSVSGVIVIRAFPSSAPQAPFPQPDGPVTVRPGNTIAIPVVDNDISPQGGPLKVVAIEGLTEGRGEAFIGDNEVRFVAPPGDSAQPTVIFQYTVQDEDGNRATGSVTVLITDPKQPNKSPASLSLEARVFAGQQVAIKVPLLSADPEGQVVGISGLSKLPAAGEVEITSEGFIYTAATDDAGLGTQEFEFTLTDGTNYPTSVVRIGVAAVPLESVEPVVTPIPVTIGVGQSRAVPVLDELYVSTPTAVSTTLVTEGRDAPVAPRPGTGSIEVGGDERTIVYSAPASIDGQTSMSTSFSYTLVDSNGRQKQNQVLVTVVPQAPEVPPNAVDDFEKPTRQGKQVSIKVLDNDLDPNTGDSGGLTARLVPGSGGPDDLKMTNGVATFKMPKSSVRFRYEVTSKTAETTSQAVVSVPLDLGVSCERISFALRSGETKKIEVASKCSGPPGSEITVVDASVRSEIGTVTHTKDSIEFTAKDVASGAFPVEFKACVAGPSCANSTQSFYALALITGRNEPPAMRPFTGYVSAGSTSVVDLRPNLSDPNPGDVAKIRFKPAQQTFQGGKITASLDTVGRVTLTATGDAYQNGQGQATMDVSFDDGDSTARTQGSLKIVVNPSEAGAVTVLDDTARVIVSQPETFTVRVLDNDTNPSGDGRATLNVASVSPPVASSAGAAGTTKVNADGTTITYTPNGTFGGRTTFTYAAQDPSDSARKGRGTVTANVIGYPGQAGTPSGVGRKSREIPLVWGAADANGGTITGYDLECRISGGGGCGAGVPTRVNGTGVTVTGLRNGTAYEFRVRAVNEAGASRSGADGWSSWSAPIIPDSLPTVTVKQVGDFSQPSPYGPNYPDGVGGQLTITWDAQVDGSPISSYRVSVNGASQTVAAGTTAFQERRLVWTGLTNTVRVDVTVSATNDAGESTSVSMAGRPVGVPPGAVVDSTSSDDSSVTITFSWTPQANVEAPTRFRIVDNYDNSSEMSGSAGTQSKNFPVSQGTDVRYQIQAMNSAGWGPAGPWSEPVKAVGNPDKPSGSVATSTKSGTILVNLSPPANTGGDPIKSYRVTAPGRTPITINASEATGYEWTGFTNGTIVDGNTIEVVACNKYRGTERCSESAKLTGQAYVLGTPPAFVITQTSTATDTFFAWSWPAAPDYAGFTKSYRVTYNGGTAFSQTATTYNSGTVDCAETSATITVRTIYTGALGVEFKGDLSSHTATRNNTCPVATLAIARGAASTPPAGGCATAPCAWVDATYTNLPPGTYQLTCTVPGNSSVTTSFTTSGAYSNGTATSGCAVNDGVTVTIELTGPTNLGPVSGQLP